MPGQTSLPQWQDHCHSGKITATMAGSMPQWQDHCHSGKTTATMAGSMPQWQDHCHSEVCPPCPRLSPPSEFPSSPVSARKGLFCPTPAPPTVCVWAKGLPANRFMFPNWEVGRVGRGVGRGCWTVGNICGWAGAWEPNKAMMESRDIFPESTGATDWGWSI